MSRERCLTNDVRIGHDFVIMITATYPNPNPNPNPNPTLTHIHIMNARTYYSTVH